MTSSRRFVLIDRDGTLNIEKRYLSDPAELELVPGAGEAVRRLNQAGYGVCVVTNQSGIARGYFDMARLDQVHRRLAELLAAEGARIDGLYLCPHGPDDTCQCRKPLPGMVDQAVADHGFDPRLAFVVGDKEIDVRLGKGVGATAILVRTGYGRDYEATTAADFVADDLLEAVRFIETKVAAEAVS